MRLRARRRKELSRRKLPRSARNGGSRTLWKPCPMCGGKFSGSVRRQRNQLLRTVPDWWKGSCGPKLSRLLRGDWPRTLDELEALKRR